MFVNYLIYRYNVLADRGQKERRWINAYFFNAAKTPNI